MTTEPAPAKPASPVAAAPRPRRGRIRRLCFYVVILASGAAIGSGLTLIAVVKKTRDYRRHPEKIPALAAGRLRRALDLTAEQTRAAEGVFRRRFRDIRTDVRPHLQRLRAEIADLLDPEQAARWHAWCDRHGPLARTRPARSDE